MKTDEVVVLINKSKRVTDADVSRMMVACSLQLLIDVSPHWGAVPKLRYGHEREIAAGATPAFILDDSPSEGVLGDHSVDVDGSVTGVIGSPYVQVYAGPILDHGGGVLSGVDSVSETLSHELIEYMVDPAANRWADSPDGSDFALEACDAVEADGYPIRGVQVSNFVLPEFFNPTPRKGARFDHLGRLTAPFTMTPGGYQIHRTVDGQEDQVFASIRHRLEPGRALMTREQQRDRWSSRPQWWAGESSSMMLVFGHLFPSWKKGLKVRKARQRRFPLPVVEEGPEGPEGQAAALPFPGVIS